VSVGGAIGSTDAYGRRVLCSDFSKTLGYQAEITPAILFLVSADQGVPQPPTMRLGEPIAECGELGMHLVVVVTETDKRC
jgi:hypothetical protein